MSGDKLRAQSYQPTVNDVSKQVSALSEQVGHLGSRVNSVINAVESAANSANDRFTVVQQELLLIRQQVTGDHAPRITTLEKRPMSAHVKGATVYGIPVALVLGVLFQLLQTRFPEIAEVMRGVFEAGTQ